MSGFRIERDERSAEFYDATGADRLLIRRCPVCGTLHPPQVAHCVDSDTLEWQEADGTGTLIAWAVDHSAPLDPALAAPDGATAVFGFVELTEGPWMQVPIVDADPASLAVGAAMTVRFIRPGGGEAIPAFAPAG